MKKFIPVLPKFTLPDKPADMHLTVIVSFMSATALVTLFLMPIFPTVAESFFVCSGVALLIGLALVGNES